MPLTALDGRQLALQRRLHVGCELGCRLPRRRQRLAARRLPAQGPRRRRRLTPRERLGGRDAGCGRLCTPSPASAGGPLRFALWTVPSGRGSESTGGGTWGRMAPSSRAASRPRNLVAAARGCRLFRRRRRRWRAGVHDANGAHGILHRHAEDGLLGGADGLRVGHLPRVQGCQGPMSLAAPPPSRLRVKVRVMVRNEE